MNRFLTVISVPEALQILCRLTSPPVTEILPLWVGYREGSRG
jgi:hypothetical protein